MKNNCPLIAERVAHYIENKIIRNELKPGKRLIERTFSKQFNVSSIPVREAFRLLAAIGLVELIPRKGAQVTEITKREIEEIYAVRSYLSGLKGKLAAKNINGKDLKRIKKIFEQMIQKSQENNISSYFNLNVKFHDILTRATGNNKLCQIIENLKKQTYRFRYASMGLPGRLERSCFYHQQLIEAIEKRDEETAEKISKIIVEEAGRALIISLFP